MKEGANFEPSAEEARVLERVRNASPPKAGASFRERLKHEFVSGDFAERGVVPLPPARRRTRHVRWMAGLTAAAAAMIVTLALNEAPRWTALPSAGSGTLVVNGATRPPKNTNRQAGSMRSKRCVSGSKCAAWKVSSICPRVVPAQ